MRIEPPIARKPIKDMSPDARKLVTSIIRAHVEADWAMGFRTMSKAKMEKCYKDLLEWGYLTIIEHGEYGNPDHGFSIRVEGIEEGGHHAH